MSETNQAHSQEEVVLSHDEKMVNLAANIMYVLDSWKLSGEEIIDILALPDSIKVRHLSQFRRDKAFPDLPEVNERIRHIIGITDALQTSYPTSPHMATFWLHNKSKRFKGKSPVQIIINRGLDGLIDIRKHLDCTYDWFSDDN